MGPDHSPLSKRHGATSVAEFRARGYLPEALTNYLALIGWSPGADEEVLPIDELATRFRIEDVGHSAGVFDVEKLAWVNRHYLKAAAPARLARLAHSVSAAGRLGVGAVGRGPGVSGKRHTRCGGFGRSARTDSGASVVSFRLLRGPCARECGPSLRRHASRLAVIEALARELETSAPLIDRDAFRAMAKRVQQSSGAKGKSVVSSDPPGADGRSGRDRARHCGARPSSGR